MNALGWKRKLDVRCDREGGRGRDQLLEGRKRHVVDLLQYFKRFHRKTVNRLCNLTRSHQLLFYRTSL